jgi:hypothetical protein
VVHPTASPQLVTTKTKRRLIKLGIACLVLATFLLLTVTVITYFQPREYTSSVFLDLEHPGMVGPVDHTTIYIVCFVVAIYAPGLLLLLSAWIFGRSNAQ